MVPKGGAAVSQQAGSWPLSDDAGKVAAVREGVVTRVITLDFVRSGEYEQSDFVGCDERANIACRRHRRGLWRKQGVDGTSCRIAILAQSGLPYMRLVPTVFESDN